MDGWACEIGIPCFRPHVKRDEDGTELYEVTAADIPEIAKNSATVTVELHGNKPPITEGHRDFKPDAKEKDQPLVLGYLENFRPGRLPDGTPCVLCDRRYMTKYAEQYQRHPFPSVDYLPGRKAIVGLAKLTRPPALNTGAVYYPGTTDPVYVYTMGGDQRSEPVEPQTQTPPADPAGTPEMTPEEMAACKKVEAYLFSTHPRLKAAAEKYEFAEPTPAAGPATPQGANTEVPAEVGKKKPEEIVSNQAAGLSDLVRKYEASQSRIAELENRVQAGEVGKMLDQLEKVEMYQFDRAAEAARLLPMSPAARKARCDEIRKYHGHLPGAERIQVYQGNVEGGTGHEITKQQADQIVTYASKHGVGYEDAKAAVLAGKR